MAPVIWGLDLAEIKWSKFKSSYMWNSDYHLRRTKFIVYQCALIFCVVSESLGTAVLSDYVDSQRFLARARPGAYVFNNDYVGAASYNIFAGVFTAFIFGAAFFFDLFWPERRETRAVKLAWRICGATAVIFELASAITLTVITFKHCGEFRGISDDDGNAVLAMFQKDGGTPLCYRHNPRAVAAVAFAWPGFASTFASCVILFFSLHHDDKGLEPKSTHARERDSASVESQPAEKFDPLHAQLTSDTTYTYASTPVPMAEVSAAPQHPVDTSTQRVER